VPEPGGEHPVNTTEAIALITAAGDADELFGDSDPGGTYRRLARLTHPDAAGPRASAAFAKLSTIWQARDRVTIRTLAHAYELRRPAFRGDLATLYSVHNGLLKLVRDPSCNDLMAREAQALRTLAERGDPRYLPYVPRLVESFRHRDPAPGAVRRANVVAAAPGLRSLAEVAAQHPDGLDARDAAWMWRRLLVALGLAHRAGVVHGAVVPEHVLIQPEEHGVVLVDWCYAASAPGERIAALVPQHADDYPTEVLDGAEPGPGTDIFMAGRLMADLMGPKAPRALRAFAEGCQLRSLRQRPDDAWRLLAELDEALRRLFGPPTFRPFTML
jgi:hypothetical protein